MPNAASAAALYLRSSKDRSDVSPATQRHALEKLASSRSLSIARIYEDAVESGSTEDRPAFSALVRDLKNSNRGWTFLLVYDTSRLARRRYIAQALKYEAKKRGITIMYATRPADVDPITEVMLDSMFEAMDEVHSLTSRQKGLAGMAENVRQGWRAGGRAPFGYALKSFPTGAVREGRPVTKTKLMPSESAAAVRNYLRTRAQGMPRVEARRRADLPLPGATLIGIEWNALAYAGHTIWNKHREAGSGSKRRPRAEWHVKRDTHEALITEREADAIVAQLENSNVSHSIRQAKAAQSSFLLSGLLYSTDGRMWVGHGPYYRLRRRDDLPGKTVSAARVDEAVTRKLQEAISSDAYLEELIVASRKHVNATAPGADLEERIVQLERERARAAERSLTSDSAEVYMHLVEQRSRQIASLRSELAAVQHEATAGDYIRRLSIGDVRQLFADQDPPKAVRTLVERVVLDASLRCQVRLRAEERPRAWLSVASPAGFDSWPPELTLPIQLVGNG